MRGILNLFPTGLLFNYRTRLSPTKAREGQEGVFKMSPAYLDNGCLEGNESCDIAPLRFTKCSNPNMLDD